MAHWVFEEVVAMKMFHGLHEILPFYEALRDRYLHICQYGAMD